MNRLLISFMLSLTLTACGGRQALQRAPGEGTPPLARGATQPLAPDQFMAPSAQSRPERNAELLKQSKLRADDPFDLPPGTGTPPPPPGSPQTPQSR